MSNGGLSGSTHYTTGEFFISQPGSGGTNTGPDVTGVGYVTTDSSSSVSATSSVTRRVVTPVATTSVGTTGTATGKSLICRFFGLIFRHKNRNLSQ